NSGSNGNCYYIGNEKEAVLIDAGISCRETEKRMKRLGLPMEKVKAIFITHEHVDHIRGAEVLSKKHRLPVYITEPTWRNSRFIPDPTLSESFIAGFPVVVGDLMITPFQKSHDASDPHSFTVTNGKTTVGVFTDLGYACQNLELHLSQCHAAFLESNYDERMLETGRYPVYLKRRIRSDKGHLSNDQALEVFLKRRSADLQLVILSHLSAENNHPQVVHDLFSHHANGVKIAVASRYEETGVFQVE
ncbi:MAG: MBL fold metallo-hydrolase, partial [Syntrophothermus sp.]